MPKVVKESDNAPSIPEAVSSGRFYLYCPGCYEAAKTKFPDNEGYWMNSALHCFSDQVHQFDGNMEAPTLSPSLLLTRPGAEGVDRFCCHSFVKGGKIQFLGDCTHPLANQTVDLLDAPTLVPEEN
ncbi:MAG: ammonia monooxygenase [Armatimonadota bacterium]